MLPPHSPTRIGRYEIKSLIGAGGMGTLYLARDTNPNTYRLVALKLLNANFDSDELRERFGREARSLAALNHPNVVNIYDSGEFQWSPYIVMEYVRGETLAEKIRRKALLTIGQKLKLMGELCAGLAHAHEAGIIHRDIKPANLMVDRHGRLKLLDFGIARAEVGMTRFAPVTQVNVRIGTPGYMSPEQIEGGEVDRRSDLFAVGAVLYELISYHEAFTGSNTRQIENKVLQAEPVPLTSLIPGLDPEIDRIVIKALAKDPADRFQDATELEQVIEGVRWHLGPLETPTPTPRATPAPLEKGRKAHDSRADVAYERARAAYGEQALETAKRYCIEALAEDPNHSGARAFLQELDPRAWVVAPSSFGGVESAGAPEGPTRVSTGARYGTPAPEGPTMVSTRAQDGTSAADAATMVSTRAHFGMAAVWRRYGQTKWIIAGAVSLFVIVSVAGVAMLVSRLMSPGVALTVIKPSGGTITGGDINCGSRGSDCVARAAEGETIEFKVEADKGFRFTNYIGDCAPNGRLRMSGPRTCGATFAEEVVSGSGSAPTQLLEIAKPTGGTVVGAGLDCGTRGSVCSTRIQHGTQVTLKGWADKGFTFQGFTGQCTQSGEVDMSAPRTCGAMFMPNAVAGKPPSPPPPTGPSGPSGKPSSTSGVGGGGANTGGAAKREETGGPPEPPVRKETEETPVAPPPPPPPIPPDVQAKKDIGDLLERYRAAYEDRNYERIRHVYPKAPDMRAQFSQIKSLKYTFMGAPKYVDLDPLRGTALVEIDVTQTAESDLGKRAPINWLARIDLRKQGADNEWVIVKVDHIRK